MYDYQDFDKPENLRLPLQWSLTKERLCCSSASVDTITDEPLHQFVKAYSDGCCCAQAAMRGETS